MHGVAVPDAPLTARQVAYQLGVSVRTVHRMVEGDRLKAQRVDVGPKGALLFDAADVRAYLARRGQEGDAA